MIAVCWIYSEIQKSECTLPPMIPYLVCMDSINKKAIGIEVNTGIHY